MTRLVGEVMAIRAVVDVVKLIDGYDTPTEPVVERSDTGMVTISSDRRMRAYFKQDASDGSEGSVCWSAIVGPERWTVQFVTSLMGRTIPPPRVVRFRAGDPNTTQVWFETDTSVLPSPIRHHQSV